MSSEIIFFERQLLSLALIEKELYQLYTNLSEKTDDLASKALFSYIATDSLKHSTILVTISEEVGGSKAQEQDCDENVIYNKQLIVTLSKDIAKSGRISNEEIISLIETLANFETFLFNEYSKAFQLEYTSFKKQDPDKNNDTSVNIFNLIVDDEERHQRILATITNQCDKKSFFKNNAPIVKYQNPDSWYVPPRKQK